MTVQQVIDRAFARSRRFVPEQTATSAELVPAVYDSLQALFQIGARVNPTFYGGVSVVPYVSPGWKRPSGAESIFYIENPAGKEVVVVPMDQRKAEPGFPSIYAWGGTYYPAGVAPGPATTESLTFYYSRTPALLDDLADVIDPSFPESHRTLLELDTAIRIGIKDGGPTAEILGALGEERMEAFKRYVAFLEHETAGTRKSYGLIRKFTTNTLVPLHSFLAGEA